MTLFSHKTTNEMNHYGVEAICHFHTHNWQGPQCGEPVAYTKHSFRMSNHLYVYIFFFSLIVRCLNNIWTRFTT